MHKTLAACAAAILFSTGIAAAEDNGPPPFAHATRDSQIRIQREANAKFAQLRREWLASGRPLPPAVAPAITAGKLLTPKVNVTILPAAPALSVSYSTGKAGFCGINLYFYAPTSGQELDVYYNRLNRAPPSTKGAVTIQLVGNGYGYGQVNGYSEPGTWTLSYGYLYDCAGHYNYYNAADLQPLFNNKVALQVVNNLKPDITPPILTGANVLTPQVSLSSASPDFAARLVFSDDISGVRYTWVELCPPSGSSGNCAEDTNYLPAPQKNGSQKDYTYLGDQTTTGKWTIYGFGICDVAKNCVTDYNSTDIKALFGTTVVKVIP